MKKATKRIQFSAEDLACHEACEASLARSEELQDWCEAQDLDLPQAVEASSVLVQASRGERLDAVIEAIPFFSQRLSMGEPYEIRERVALEAHRQQLALEPGDLWFLGDCITKRNRFIESVVQKANGTARGSKVQIDLAGKRLAHRIAIADGRTVEFFGESNVRVVVEKADGQRHVGIADYKTGFVRQVSDDVSRTLAGLAALEAWRESGTATVTVAMLAANRTAAESDRVETQTFDSSQLWLAQQLVEEVAQRTHRHLFAYRAGQGWELGPALAGTNDRAAQQFAIAGQWSAYATALAATLDRVAQPGAHCEHCVGKLCCGRLQHAAKEFQHKLVEPAGTIGPVALATLARFKQEPAQLENPMHLATLSQILDVATSLHEEGAPFRKLKTEGEDLARQLIAKGTEVPGFALKEGTKRFVLREDEAAAKTPVYDRLKPVLKGTPQAAFQAAVAFGEPGVVRDMLADLHGVPPKQVFDDVLKPLGEANPFEMRPNKPSVVRAVGKTVTVDADKIKVSAEMPPLPKDAKGAAAKTAKR